MDQSRVTPTVLTERLDAEFYRPSFLENERRLRQLETCARLEEACTQIKLGYTGPIDKYYGNPGACFLTSKNVAEGRLHIAPDIDRIRYEVHNGVLSSTQARNGDLLFSRTGTVGKAAVLTDDQDDYNFAAHLFALRVTPEIDSFFLAAFFNCRYGRLQSERTERGTIIRGISIYDMPKMLFPRFSRSTQLYIADKLRTAQVLRDASENIISRISCLHRSLIPDEGRVFARSQFRRVATTELTERLDSHFYPGAVAQYFGEEKRLTRETLKSIGCSISSGSTRDEAVGPQFALQATVANLSNRFPDKRFRRVSPIPPCPLVLQEHDLLFCNAAHNKDYIGREITYCDSRTRGVVPSTEVMVIRADRSKLPASYVREFLLTEIGYLQIQSTIRGITAHSYPTDVETLYIPMPKISQESKIDFFATDDLMLLAGRMVREAEQLVNVGMCLVEGLIDGILTQEDLSTAMLQLNEGDTSADRAILGRLFEGGVDAVHTPSFIADLDAYYETVQTAKRHLSDEGKQ